MQSPCYSGLARFETGGAVALIDFQTALGSFVRLPNAGARLEAVRLDDRERASLAKLLRSDGFRVTVAIQRSWCEGRAARGAQLTLSVVPEPQRTQLLKEWVATGAGTSSFFEATADEFFDFLSTRLRDDPTALRFCEIERATLRARERADDFEPPPVTSLDDPDCVVCTSPFSALVVSNNESERVLFAPGLVGLWRPASAAEVELLTSLSVPVTVHGLLRTGHQRSTIDTLLAVGAIEIAQER